MKLIRISSGAAFAGELVEGAGREDHGLPVLVLTPVAGGKQIAISPVDQGEYGVVEATLDERSRLDRAGYRLAVDLAYRSRRRRRPPR